MIVQFYDDFDRPLLPEPIRIKGAGPISGGKPIRLMPGRVYWLRIYLEAGESRHAWRPMERDDITILEVRTDARDQGGEPDAPPGAASLLVRVRFEAYNDGALRKVVRWVFRAVDADGDEDRSTYRTWRIPLYVKESQTAVRLLVASFVIGVTVPEWTEALLIGWGLGDALSALVSTALVYAVATAVLWTVNMSEALLTSVD